MRLVVIGVSGSGKTTLARQIARTLALPHVELDALYWEANWQAASRPVFRGRVQEATAGDAWVVDGNYSQSRDIVWSRATHLAWLDYGLISVMARVLWRTACRLFSQQELWNGNQSAAFSDATASYGMRSQAIAATDRSIWRFCRAQSSVT
jgi:adenylate kinase family enzyme